MRGSVREEVPCERSPNLRPPGWNYLHVFCGPHNRGVVFLHVCSLRHCSNWCMHHCRLLESPAGIGIPVAWAESCILVLPCRALVDSAFPLIARHIGPAGTSWTSMGAIAGRSSWSRAPSRRAHSELIISPSISPGLRVGCGTRRWTRPRCIWGTSASLCVRRTGPSCRCLHPAHAGSSGALWWISFIATEALHSGAARLV